VPLSPKKISPFSDFNRLNGRNRLNGKTGPQTLLDLVTAI
jgi:hypothetical protein